MSVSHTPGPWHVSGFERTTRGVPRVVMGADGFSIAHIMDRSAEENQADAQLIAAAPELLASLQALFESCRNAYYPGSYEDVQVLSNARAAIAKATGSAS